MTNSEQNTATLITLLEQQNQLLREQVEAQAKQIQSLNEMVTQLQERDDMLIKMVNEKSARIEELLKQIYGRKSEKRPNESARGLSSGATNKNKGEGDKGEGDKGEGDKGEGDKGEGDKGKKGKRNKRKGKGNKFQMPEGLPEEIIHIDLFDCEKTNPETGEIFPVLEEERKELLVKEITYKKIVLVRNVYAGGLKYGILRADWPKQVLNNTSMDATLLADSIIKRCLEHNPFHRQVDSYQREGFSTTRQTLNQSFIGIALDFEPLHKLLQKDILAQNVIHADETFLKLQAKGNGKLKDCYMWFLCARAKEIAHTTLPALQPSRDCVLPDQSLIYIEFADNRRHENAEKIIEGFSGKLHSDCYEAYEKMSIAGKIIWQPCLTHARRKFIKAPETPLNREIIGLMSKIIAQDNELWVLDEYERLRMRQSEIKRYADELVKLLEEKRDNLAVQLCKKTSEAFNYFLSRKESFLRFLDDAQLMVDNNLAERAIRPIKIGLKNWLFIGSARGGKAAAIMYSLLLTCKNIGIEPKAWLTDVIRNFPYTAEEDYHTLLPQNWQPKINPKSPYLPAEYRN